MRAHEHHRKQYALDAEKYENPWVIWKHRTFGDRWFPCTQAPSWQSGEYMRQTPATNGRFPKVKGHPHAELIAQYAEDAKTNPEPWKLWQVYNRLRKEWVLLSSSPLWHKDDMYRRKPQTTKRYIYTRLAYNSFGGTELYTAQFDNCNPENVKHHSLMPDTVKWAEPAWDIREVQVEVRN